MITGKFTLTDENTTHELQTTEFDAIEFFIDFSGSATIEIRAKKLKNGEIEETLTTINSPTIFRIDSPNLQSFLIFERTAGSGVDVKVEWSARPFK